MELNKLRVEILKDISDNSMKAGGKFIDNFLSKISKEMNLSKAAYYQLVPDKGIYTMRDWQPASTIYSGSGQDMV